MLSPFGGSAILRAPDSDAGGGGGGAGEPLFSEAQQAAIGQIVNSAVTSQLKRSLGPGIAEALKATKWDEVLAPAVTGMFDNYMKSLPEAGGDDGGDDKKKPGKKTGADTAVEAQLQKLATELENERKARQAAETARQEAEQKRLMDGAMATFRNALQPKLRNDLLDVAVGHFGRELKLGEDGSALLRVKRSPYKGAPEEDTDLPLSEAIPILLSTDGIKPFLPAPGANTEPLKRGNGPSRPTFNPLQGAGPTDPASKTLAELNAAGVSLDDI